MAARAAQAAGWICSPCALNAGAAYIPGHLCTMHDGECDVCKRRCSVTRPHHFAWQQELFSDD